MSSCNIFESSNQSESTLKFTAGLVMSVPLEAELMHISEPARLRLKIKYPDQKVQVVVPRPADLKPLLYGDTEGTIIDCTKEILMLKFIFTEPRAGHNLRLLTTVLISHQVWSEACNVEISMAVAVPEADIGKRKPAIETASSLIELCKPVKFSVAPKPIKKLQRESFSQDLKSISHRIC